MAAAGLQRGGTRQGARGRDLGRRGTARGDRSSGGGRGRRARRGLGWRRRGAGAPRAGLFARTRGSLIPHAGGREGSGGRSTAASGPVLTPPAERIAFPNLFSERSQEPHRGERRLLWVHRARGRLGTGRERPGTAWEQGRSSRAHLASFPCSAGSLRTRGPARALRP